MAVVVGNAGGGVGAAMIVPARKMEMTRIAGERRGDAPGASFWRGPGERLARRRGDGSAAVVPRERMAGLTPMECR